MNIPNINTTLHFLIVNDNAIQRRVLVQLLKELGYLEVSEASNGAMALRSFHSARAIGAPIHFAMTDCQMPEMDGLTFLMNLRHDETLMYVPVLMITSQATEIAILNAMKAGADGYMVKPFTRNKLREKIEKLLHKYELSVRLKNGPMNPTIERC